MAFERSIIYWLLGMTILTAIFPKALELGSNNLIQFGLGALVIAICAFYIIMHDTKFWFFPGVIFFLFFCLITPVAHGYFQYSLFWGFLTVLLVPNVKIEESNLFTISRFLVVTILLIILLIFAELAVNRNLHFIRDLDFALPVTTLTALRNPNVISRVITMLLPCLTLCYLYGFIGKKWFYGLICAPCIAILFMAFSRANLLTLILMFAIWGYYRGETLFRRIASKQMVIGVASIIVIFFVLMSYNQEYRQRIFQTQKIFYQFTTWLESSDFSLGSVGELSKDQLKGRARLWAISLALLNDSPYVGVGQRGAAIINDIGVIKQIKVGNTIINSSIAIHGSLFNILANTGLVGLALYCFILIRLAYFFHRAAITDNQLSGVLGQMFLLGSSFSQISASNNTELLFWALLGLHVAVVHWKPVTGPKALIRKELVPQETMELEKAS